MLLLLEAMSNSNQILLNFPNLLDVECIIEDIGFFLHKINMNNNIKQRKKKLIILDKMRLFSHKWKLSAVDKAHHFCLFPTILMLLTSSLLRIMRIICLFFIKKIFPRSVSFFASHVLSRSPCLIESLCFSYYLDVSIQVFSFFSK